MTAVAGASGVRSWLGTRRFNWLTPRRLRLITVGLVAGALLASSILMGGATAPEQGGHPGRQQAVHDR